MNYWENRFFAEEIELLKHHGFGYMGVYLIFTLGDYQLVKRGNQYQTNGQSFSKLTDAIDYLKKKVAPKNEDLTFYNSVSSSDS